VSGFDGLGPKEAREFASRWLPAWTGGDPESLLAFYTDDVFYRDPAVADGVRGKEALRVYFGKLLGTFPNWVWTQTHSTPIESGFLNHWHAEIPVNDEVVACEGVCTVRLRDGLIERNEVFFDRSKLLRALEPA
jgi:steroid delta-isomerase-like uncharacterized protein